MHWVSVGIERFKAGREGLMAPPRSEAAIVVQCPSRIQIGVASREVPKNRPEC